MNLDEIIRVAAERGLDLEAQSDIMLVSRLNEAGQDLSKLSKPSKTRLTEIGYLTKKGKRFHLVERTEK